MGKDEARKAAIASRLRKARELAGLSQGQVARIMGLHRPSISEIEAAHRSVTAEELARFSEVYGVQISWLAGAHKEGEDENDQQVQLAARELKGLKPDEFQRLMELLRIIRPHRKSRP